MRIILLLIITFICSFIILSLPAIFGAGVIIEWAHEPTFLEKVNAHIIDGFTNGYIAKSVISLSIGILVAVILKVKAYLDKHERREQQI